MLPQIIMGNSNRKIEQIKCSTPHSEFILFYHLDIFLQFILVKSAIFFNNNIIWFWYLQAGIFVMFTYNKPFELHKNLWVGYCFFVYHYLKEV